MQLFALFDEFIFLGGLTLSKHLRVENLSGAEFGINCGSIFRNGHAFVLELFLADALVATELTAAFGALFLLVEHLLLRHIDFRLGFGLRQSLFNRFDNLSFSLCLRLASTRLLDGSFFGCRLLCFLRSARALGFGGDFLFRLSLLRGRFLRCLGNSFIGFLAARHGTTLGRGLLFFPNRFSDNLCGRRCNLLGLTATRHLALGFLLRRRSDNFRRRFDNRLGFGLHFARTHSAGFLDRSCFGAFSFGLNRTAANHAFLRSGLRPDRDFVQAVFSCSRHSFKCL